MNARTHGRELRLRIQRRTVIETEEMFHDARTRSKRLARSALTPLLEASCYKHTG
jgi:hypothetical protein